MQRGRDCALLLAATVLGVMLGTEPGQAHKPITSKYTYTEDVFPIVSQRCGRCHITGGIAPMSLLTYKEAVPWAESIRVELMTAHMPPGCVDPEYGELLDSRGLSSRELDILLTWATGGTPQGPAKRLPTVALKNEWRGGPPDLALPMPEAFTLAADKMEDTREFILQAGGNRDRWIKAADLLPGTPAIVRNALIYARGSDRAPETILAAWVPGQDPVPTATGVAFRWAAGTDLVLRIHYRKTWKYEGAAVTDRSTVGLYSLDRPAGRQVRALEIAPPSLVVDEDLQALAVRPDGVDQSDVELRVEAVRPDGTRAPMIGVTMQPNWERRYWFGRPVSLPRGSRINIASTSKAGDRAGNGRRPRVWLDVVRLSHKD